MAMLQSKDGGRLSRGDPAPKAGSLKNKIKPCSRAAQAREGGSKQHGGKGHETLFFNLARDLFCLDLNKGCELGMEVLGDPFPHPD